MRRSTRAEMQWARWWALRQLPQQRLGNIEEDQIVELAHLAPQVLLGRFGQNDLDLLIPLGERQLQMTIRGLGHPL
jgi:hypothetical protein